MKSGFIYYNIDRYQFEYSDNHLIISTYGKECTNEFDSRNIKVFEGEYFPSNKKIIFYKAAGFSKVNHIQESNVDLVFISKFNYLNDIKVLNFSCRELDVMYDKRIIKDVSYDDFFLDGRLDISIAEYKETDSQKYKVNIDGKDMYFSIVVSRGISKKIKSGLSTEIILRVEGDFDKNYDLIFRTIDVVKNVFSYLFYRKNIFFNKISFGSKNVEGKYWEEGTIDYIENQNIINIPDDGELKKRYVLFSSIESIFGQIIQSIVDGSIYTRNIPADQIEKSRITPSRIIMTTSTFEHEFKLNFPNGVKHRQKTIDKRESLLKLMDDLEADERLRPYLKEWNKFKENIFFDNLSSRIYYAIEEYSSIIDKIANKIYTLNSLEYNLSIMSESVEKLRNDYAHGNSKLEYNYNEVLGIIILERTIYVMQLKRLGLSEKNIKSFIFKLFG